MRMDGCLGSNVEQVGKTDTTLFFLQVPSVRCKMYPSMPPATRRLSQCCHEGGDDSGCGMRCFNARAVGVLGDVGSVKIMLTTFVTAVPLPV